MPGTDLTASTLRPAGAGAVTVAPKVPALTILHHADRTRVGEVCRLVDLLEGRTVRVSRAEPGFAAPGTPSTRPLADPFVARKGVVIAPGPRGGVEISPGGTNLLADGVPVGTGGASFGSAALDAGVVLELEARVVLLMHRVGLPVLPRQPMGMIGTSEAIEQLRADIARVADLDVPVLVRGETGTGKELVARALHEHGPRREQPFVAVNMAALPPTTAASELFGHAAGAFTGATRAHAGHFQDAHGGTLFLDEIADVPGDVQAALLRVLETGEVQPLGSPRRHIVDVRLVAATDADLEELIASGSFREPLFHRLAGYQLYVPPLRQRREDIGRLLHHFLAAEMERVGELGKLDRPVRSEQMWAGADLAGRLARHDWPGNVRQLRNTVRQLVISSRGLDTARLDAAVSKLIDELPQLAPTGGAPRAAGSKVTDDELVSALRQHAWKTSATAVALGISRTTLYALIDRSTAIRKARDIPRDELVHCLASCNGDVDAAAARLEVSKRGLQLRISEEGL